MGDIDYWFKTYSDHVSNYESKVDAIGAVAAGDSIDDRVAVCAKLEKKCTKGKKSLDMELRLVKDSDTRGLWETKITETDDRLAAAKRALTMKKEQAELFAGADANGGGGGGGAGYVGPTNDQYLDKTEAVHDRIDDSLANAANLVGEAEDVGTAVLESLAEQRNQLAGIHSTVLNIEDALKRSDALLRTFGKRMATDKMIQFFFMLNFLGLIAIIVYSVMKDQGLTDDDDPEAPADDATPSTDDYKATASSGADNQAGDASGDSGSTSTTSSSTRQRALLERAAGDAARHFLRW